MKQNTDTRMSGPRRRLRPALFAGVSVTVAASVVGVAATNPQSVSAPLVDLAALIVSGSSTHPTGAGNENFYGGLFTQPAYNPSGDIVHVNFFTGPPGIDQAVRTSPDPDDVVLASGWGAANASLLMTVLNTANPNDPTLTDTTWVLDNNVSRANGGYGTRYPAFALLGVNPLPTPTDVAANVLDVGYEYDLNSNAPAYLLNVFALANSLAAYLEVRLNQQDIELPQAALDDMDGNDLDPGQHYHFIVAPDGTYDAVSVEGTVTYVTFRKDGLPLANLMRMLPGGDILADGLEPLLTELVKAGYPNNNPLSDPSVYTPAGLLPPPAQLIQTALALPGALQQGASNVEQHLSVGSFARTVTTTTDDEPDATPQRKKPPPRNKVQTNVLRPSPDAAPESPGTTADNGAGGPARTAIESTVDSVSDTVKDVVDGDTKPAGDTKSANEVKT